MQGNINVGFLPEIDENSKVLILGSFPSVKSREVGFYYGNPQNRFWKMLAVATGKTVPCDISGKKIFLRESQIALWDVIDSSSIVGSSDSAFTSENYTPVNINEVLSISQKLELIICNGKKAFEIFNQICPHITTPCKCLPSTSSANPRFSMDEWVNTLKTVL